ncbi:MAG: RNA polymerase sigma factor, partial [Gaiellaceae bacterium]
MVVASGDVHLPRFVRPQAGAEVDRLYRRYAGEVLAYALRVMRSRPDAEDIVQTVFVRALGAIERGEKVRAPRNWLIKIAHNECRRLISSRKVHAELPEEVAVEPSEAVDVAQLRTAMAALAEAQCQALVLRELEGRTYAEIASTLGLTVSAVETLIFRARRALREQLEGSMSCADFALLLDDASARSRVRAHARICAGCATLERQARGRKGALKRIASMLGLPWWGAKIAAVGLTAGVVVAVGAVPQHGARTPIPRSGTIAPSVATPRPVQPVAVAPVPAVPHRLPAPSARRRSTACARRSRGAGRSRRVSRRLAPCSARSSHLCVCRTGCRRRCPAGRLRVHDRGSRTLRGDDGRRRHEELDSGSAAPTQSR